MTPPKSMPQSDEPVRAPPPDTHTKTGRTIAMKDVIRLTPIAATLRERTSGSIDLGLGFLNAHDELDLTLNAAAENRTRNYLTEASLSLLLRRLAGEAAQRRNHFDVRSRRFGRNRWFGLGTLELEENRALDLDQSVPIGSAPGRTLIQSSRTVRSIYAGVDYRITEYRGIEGRDNSAEGLAAVEWDWFELGGSTESALEATTYVGLDESRTRFELRGSLRRDIARGFYWSLSLYQSYNSDPPLDRERSDFGLGLTIGRSF